MKNVNALEIFNKNVGPSNVQYSEAAKWFDLYKDGKLILGTDSSEVEALITELKEDPLPHSNDGIIDMIISKVNDSTKDENLSNLLRGILISSMKKDKKFPGRAHEICPDGSSCIEIGYDIQKRIELLSDLFAVFAMGNDNSLLDGEKSNLLDLLKVCRNRYITNTDDTGWYRYINIKMILIDKYYTNGFADKFAAYSLEIYEMAISFFVGHEIGHLYHGHVNDHKPKAGIETQLAELKADSFALSFAFEYMGSAYKNDKQQYPIHLFASVYLPLIASIPLDKNILKDTEFHPAIIRRLLGVQRGLKEKISLEAWEAVDRYKHNLLDVVNFKQYVVKADEENADNITSDNL